MEYPKSWVPDFGAVNNFNMADNVESEFSNAKDIDEIISASKSKNDANTKL